MGNDLELTDLDSGRRLEGTISGDQLRGTYSEQTVLGGFQIDAYGEAEGTVLNANRIDITEEANITVELDEETVTIGAVCSYHGQRTG